MKLHIRSFEYSIELPKSYIEAIKKVSNDGNLEIIKDDGDEIAIIEVDSLEVLPKLEKSIREIDNVHRSMDFWDIHGLILNTLDEKQKVYQIDIYDGYNE